MGHLSHLKATVAKWGRGEAQQGGKTALKVRALLGLSLGRAEEISLGVTSTHPVPGQLGLKAVPKLRTTQNTLRGARWEWQPQRRPGAANWPW